MAKKKKKQKTNENKKRTKKKKKKNIEKKTKKTLKKISPNFEENFPTQQFSQSLPWVTFAKTLQIIAAQAPRLNLI